MINSIDARNRIKRSIIPGAVPTLPPSADFTDGTWLITDTRPGEFFWNMADQKLYIGNLTGFSLVTTIASGMTGAYLPLSGGVMDSGAIIKSANGGGQIDLDLFGSASQILISNDNASFSGAYMTLTPTNDILMQAASGSFWSANAGGSNLQVNGNSNIIASIGGNELFITNSSLGDTTGTAPTTYPVAISAGNWFIQSGVTNSVILGGTNISATTSNTVYVPNLVVTGSFTTSGSPFISQATNNIIANNGANPTVSSGTRTMLIGSNNGFAGTTDGFVGGSVMTLTGVRNFAFGSAFTIGGSDNAAIGGDGNIIGALSTLNFLGGGATNRITTSNRSAIIGGSGNTLSSTSNTVILGGLNITATTNNTVYMPKLKLDPVSSLPTAEPGLMFFSGSPLFRMIYFTGTTAADYIII